MNSPGATARRPKNIKYRKRFLASGRAGFYFSVTHEGKVGAGDEIELITREPNGAAVSEITRLYTSKSYGDADVVSVRRGLRVAAFPESRKEYLLRRLEKIPTLDSSIPSGNHQF